MKVEKKGDARVVWGPATDGMLDLDDQIVDPEWAAEKLTQWFSDLEKGGFNATIHQMHSPFLAPAGKGKNLVMEDGAAWVRAKIVEPTAVTLIDEDVYKGLSIGILDPPIFPDPHAKGGRIGRKGAGGFINEVSLVDVPANPRALFSVAKRAKVGGPIEVGGEMELIDRGRMGKANRRLLTKAFASAMSGNDALSTALHSRLVEPPKGKKTGKAKTNRDAKIPKARKALAASQWYSLVKRDMDPNVGGGVDRDALSDSDFVFPKTRDFPVVTPGDVEDAVSSWGRYKGSETFESFKKKLTALARRKGQRFVAELPEAWSAKRGAKKMAKKSKADQPGDGDGRPDGASDCPVCHGSGEVKSAKCFKCKGKGWMKGKGKAAPKSASTTRVPISAARSAMQIARSLVTKGASPDAAVDDAIVDLLEATGEAHEAAHDAAGAQLADDASETGEHAKTAKGAKAKPDDGDGDGNKPPWLKPKKGGKKKSKKGKRAKGKKTGVLGGAGGLKAKGKGRGTIPATEMRLHDLLCPAYPTKAVKSLYPLGSGKGALPVPEVIDPGYFGKQLSELTSSRRKADKGSVAAAFQAEAAATHLASLRPTTLLEMRDAAAKGFSDAYPSVKVKPTQIEPERFHRPFLSGATPEASSTTRVKLPDLESQLSADDFHRPPLTTNEARPTLSGGSSVVKSGRDFYTNAAKDDSASAMELLHAHIADRYPGVCPMKAVMPGTGIDSDGLMGTAAEMQAKGPSVGAVPIPHSGAGSGTLRPVGKSKAGKRKGSSKATEEVALGPKALEAFIGDTVAKALEGPNRRVKSLKKALRQRDKTLKKALRQPDPTRRAQSGKSFTPKVVGGAAALETDPTKREVLERVKILKSRVHDGNSQTAATAQEELMRLLTPKEYARVVTADED